MSTTPYPQPDNGPSDDDSTLQQCEEKIDALEAWAQNIGAKVGIPFTPAGPDNGDEDPLKAAIAGTKGAFGS